MTGAKGRGVGLPAVAVWVTLLLMIQNCSQSLVRAMEYCLEQQLDTKCGSDEIIVVDNAQYGRMRINRCVHTDYGYIGCGTDVTDVLVGTCSGRHRCRVVNIEALFAAWRVCPIDLKSYLQVNFSCIKVVMPPVSANARPRCLSHSGGGSDGVQNPASSLPPQSDYLVIRPESHGRSGVLASITAHELGVGMASCPWLIVASPGQRINITLMDFATYNRSTSRVKRNLSPAGRTGRYDARTRFCREYAVVSEDTATKNLVVCSDRGPQTRLVYVSKSHKLKVIFSDTMSSATDSQPYFAIKYEVFGCAHPPTPHGAHIVAVSHDVIKVRCNVSSESWTLKCTLSGDQQWTGTTGNCSAMDMLNGTNDVVENYLPYGLSLLVVIVVALFICVLTLGTGLAYMHSRRDIDRPLGKHRNLPSSSSTYALAPVSCPDSQQTTDTSGFTVVPSSPTKACTLPARVGSPSPRTCRRLQVVGYSPATMRRFVVDSDIDAVTRFNDLDVWKNSRVDDDDDLSVLPHRSASTWQRCNCSTGPVPCITSPDRVRRPLPPTTSTFATSPTSFSTFKPSSPSSSRVDTSSCPITLRPERCGDVVQSATAMTRPQQSCHGMSLHLHVKHDLPVCPADDIDQPTA